MATEAVSWKVGNVAYYKGPDGRRSGIVKIVFMPDPAVLAKDPYVTVETKTGVIDHSSPSPGGRPVVIKHPGQTFRCHLLKLSPIMLDSLQ